MQLSGTMVPSKDNCVERMQRKLDSIEDTLQTLAQQQEQADNNHTNASATHNPTNLNQLPTILRGSQGSEKAYIIVLHGTDVPYSKVITPQSTPQLNFGANERGACWGCAKQDHQRKDCPENPWTGPAKFWPMGGLREARGGNHGTCGFSTTT